MNVPVFPRTRRTFTAIINLLSSDPNQISWYVGEVAPILFIKNNIIIATIALKTKCLIFPGEGKPAQKNKNKNKNRKGNQPEEKKMKEPRDSKQNAKKKNQAAGKKSLNAKKKEMFKRNLCP